MLCPDDPRLNWQGVVSLEKSDDWVKAWRIPFEERPLFPPDALRDQLDMPTGVRISFRSDTTVVAGRILPVQDMSRLDLCCDGNLSGSVEMSGRDSFRFDGLRAGEKLIEMWLPMVGAFHLRSLELSNGASVAAFEDERPRWITYGSSITKCGGAESPTQTWPAIVARERGLDLTCLGFGGQCHVDSMFARLIRDLPADFISLWLGINVYGGNSLNERSFRPAIIGFVKIIREKHPNMPLALISPIVSPPHETTPNTAGFTLQAMREEVAAAVSALQSCGDNNIHYINGLEIFGQEQTHMQPDGCHPDAAGYKAMGRNFLDKVIPEVSPA